MSEYKTYQIAMVVNTDEGFFALEDWITSLPEIHELIDYGLKVKGADRVIVNSIGDLEFERDK